MEALKQRYKSLRTKMIEGVDGASLVAFRVFFGLTMMVEVYRYFSKGWIARYFITPEFHFKYYGFEWVQAWPGDGMLIHWGVMGVLAFLITIGAFYRISIILFLLMFSQIFLIDQATYLNHFYLVIIVTALMCILPANRAYSVDAWLFPKIKNQLVPKWSLWAFRFQVEILLILAGLVKINYDWLHLMPLKMWFLNRADMSVLGPFVSQEWFVILGVYGVIILHVLGAPLLFFKRTRIWVFLLYCVFHISNHFIFNIGIFPWFTIFLTLIFFDPNWPRQVFANVTKKLKPTTRHLKYAAGQVVTSIQSSKAVFSCLFAFLIVWFSFQILFPFRHLLYPGNVAWTEEGHRFAWRMKLRSKNSRAIFLVKDPTSEKTWRVSPNHFLTRRQASKMPSRPDMILQYAHYLKKVWADEYDVKDVEVYAYVQSSLNYRRPQILIDPKRDLGKVKRELWPPADWILPLNEPLFRDKNNDT